MPQPKMGLDQNGSGIPPTKAQAVRMLDERASIPDTDVGRDRRLMVRFDAWTDPRIFSRLNEYKESMSKEARSFFFDAQPDIDASVLRCAFALLTPVPLDRARMAAAGKNYKVPVRVKGDAKLMLQAIKVPLGIGKNVKNPSVRVLLPLLIKKLANYLHAIFNLHLKSGARPSRRLDTTFARFASGELRIKPGGPHPWMNAEPDSAYFFSLAEFCIQAAHFRAYPGRRWWLDLGGLFAALQDTFCVRYHESGGERRFGAYSDKNFNEKRKLPLDVLLKHVESVRVRCGTIEKLVEQVTWNAFWSFLDDVQPLTEPPKTMAKAPARRGTRSMRNGSSVARV